MSLSGSPSWPVLHVQSRIVRLPTCAVLELAGHAVQSSGDAYRLYVPRMQAKIKFHENEISESVMNDPPSLPISQHASLLII